MKVSVILFAAAAAAVFRAQDSVSATRTGCEAHGDHWHCPSGIPEPTTPPAQTTLAPAAKASQSYGDDDDEDHDHEATASTCEPHGDHWHCPSGVAEPTTPPAAVSSAASSATTTASSSAPAQQSTNAAGMLVVGGRMQGGMAAALGAVAYLL
ncbi:Nn.00g075290.m01.CDS01 [Neocucurbitaria sp. VM-36]